MSPVEAEDQADEDRQDPDGLAERGDGHERLADAHRPVAARVLDRVPGLVRRHAERGERRGLADVGRQVQRLAAGVVVVGEPAGDRADLEPGQAGRAQHGGRGLGAAHAVARRDLGVALERALDAHLSPQPEQQRDAGADEPETDGRHGVSPPGAGT